jgi:hypothetical protein
MDRLPAESASAVDPALQCSSQAAAARGSWHSWRTVVIALAILAVAIALLRLRTYDEPYEADLAIYMYVGHAINTGGQLYAAAYEIKPPLLHVLYALAERLAGYGEPEIYLLNVAAAVFTLAGVYAAGAARGTAAGLWAAAFWTLLHGAPTLQANQPNSEVFINGCVIWALALLLRAGRDSGVGPVLGTGVLFALGSAVKQLVVVDAALLSCAHVAFPPGGPAGRRRALRDVAIMAGIGAAFWAAIVGYFAVTSEFELFWVTTFGNNVAYIGNPLFNMYRYIREGRILPGFLGFALPVAALVVLGGVHERRPLRRREWALFLAAVASIQIKIPLNGTGFLPHYYQYYLPLLAVGAGWAAGSTSRTPGRLPSWVMTAACIAVAGYLVIDQGRYYLLPPDEWSRIKYGRSILDTRDLARAIKDLLRPGETLYYHSSRPGPEIYYYAGRRPPSLLLWAAYLNDNSPVAEELVRRHLAALRAAPPTLVVDERLPEFPPAAPSKKPGLAERLLHGEPKIDEGHNSKAVLDALLPGYRPIEGGLAREFPSYRFYVLRDSALDERLEGEAEGRMGDDLSDNVQ